MRAFRSASCLGRGTVCVLALAAAIGHAEQRTHEPDAAEVFYVSATVAAGDAGGLVGSVTTGAFANAECGWEDPPIGAALGCAPPVVEGARQRVVVRLVDAEGNPVAADTDLAFRYSTRPASAMADVDYQSASGTVTINAGELVSSPATFTTLDDVLDEFQEVFAVELQSDSGSTVDVEFDYVVIPINDNDPEVRVSIAGDDVDEDAGILSFEVSLRGKSGKRVTVDFSTSDGSATAGADYESVSGTLTFEPGDLTKTVEVTLIDDAIHEPVESFELRLTNADNARLPRAPARGTIRDDDVYLTMTGASATEGSGPLEFTVTAVNLAAGRAPVTVDYATEDGTATAGEDYDPVSGTLAFTAESSAQIIPVPLVDDGVDEPDETLTVMLSEAVNATIGTVAVAGIIEDDDPFPELAISDASAEEGGVLGFLVSLSGQTARTVTVDYATEDGTAKAGTDYRTTSGTLTFAPGESSANIPVEIVDDETYEQDETFVARLSSPVHAVIAVGEAAGTILDDDEEPAAVAVHPENPLLCVGGEPTRIDLSRHFSGDNLTYTVSDPDPSVATASVDGTVLVLTPVAEGATSVTVTATNMGSQAAFDLAITVVADPAELAAIKRGLAVVGGMILNDVVDAIGDRFVNPLASDRRSTGSPSTLRAFEHRASSPLNEITNSGRLGGRQAASGWPTSHPADISLVDSGSLAFSAAPRSGAGIWSVWGRGSAQRYDDGDIVKDGTFTALQAGADARFGDWLIGAAGLLGRADAEYAFERSMDACGGGGAGEGVLETETSSIHPYLGRRVGRGWLWGTVGVGTGQTVVERCVSGQRTEADLSMRMGALGGRHVIRGGERIEVALVEDLGVLRAKTEATGGPAGNHDVSVGRARVGVEARGVCATGAGIVGWARAFARHDWGDGIEGSGAEVALGARLDAPERRLRLEAGVHALAVHTADDYSVIGGNVSAAYLPQADGTGLQVSMALRQGALEETGVLGENWQPPQGPRSVRQAVRGELFVGFGFRAPRGLARPFAAVGKSNRGSRIAVGLRHESLGVLSPIVGEFSIGHRRGVGEGSFVMARLEARR